MGEIGFPTFRPLLYSDSLNVLPHEYLGSKYQVFQDNLHVSGLIQGPHCKAPDRKGGSPGRGME